MKKLCAIALFVCSTSKAALPFVTDDAFIQKPKQLAIETFTEVWSVPDAKIYGQYISLSYGFSNRLELTAGSMGGVQSSDKSLSLMNPLLQLKAKIFDGGTILPSLAIDFGYINKNGVGGYYDAATNYYAIAASTISIKSLQIHTNLGVKSSFDIPSGNMTRPHIGIAFDYPPFENEKLHLIFESYNGAPNSPRDSDGLFKSYQLGVKIIKSQNVSYHALYGSQPTFEKYEGKIAQYAITSWVQVGVRKALQP